MLSEVVAPVPLELHEFFGFLFELEVSWSDDDDDGGASPGLGFVIGSVENVNVDPDKLLLLLLSVVVGERISAIATVPLPLSQLVMVAPTAIPSLTSLAALVELGSLLLFLLLLLNQSFFH